MGCKSVGCTVKLDDRNDRKTYFVEIALSFLPFLYHCVEAQHILCGGLTPMVRRLNTNHFGGL